MLPGRTGFLHLLLWLLSSALFLVHSTFSKVWQNCSLGHFQRICPLLNFGPGHEPILGEDGYWVIKWGVACLWWLTPVCVCCLCCWSIVAQTANAVGSLRKSRVSLVTELSVCRWNHVWSLQISWTTWETSQRQWFIWGSVIWLHVDCGCLASALCWTVTDLWRGNIKGTVSWPHEE